MIFKDKKSYLFHPNDIREIDPRPWIGYWEICAILPLEGTILLQKAFQTAAAGTAIKPDRNLIRRIRVLWREEPKVELPIRGGIRNW